MSRQCGGLFGSHYNSMNSRFCGSKFGANGQATTTASTGTPVCGNKHDKDIFMRDLLHLL